MSKPFFKIVIPAYNAEKTIERAIDSVKKQSFKDYILVVVDDFSQDKTIEIVKRYSNIPICYPRHKRYNGGARNCGVLESLPSEYILFLDNDDEFVSEDIFQKIHDKILENDYPDLVRLPYITFKNGKDSKPRYYEEKTIKDIIHTTKVAPWTKCIKCELFEPFPENTLLEDVCQHLKQLEKIKTVVWLDEPVVRWYVRNDSASHKPTLKWESSEWRFIADLMDLDLSNPETKARRDYKLLKAKRALARRVRLK